MKALFLFIVAFGFQAEASFKNGYRSQHDIIISIYQKFHGLTTGNCQSLTTQFDREDRPILGDQNLQTGEPASNEPGTAFVSWMNQCISRYLDTIYFDSESSKDQKNIRIWNENLIPDLFAPFLAKIDAISVNDRVSVVRGSSLMHDTKDRERLVAYLVEWALGSDEEILSYGRMNDIDVFRADLVKLLGNEILLSSAAKKILPILFKRDEFLLY